MFFALLLLSLPAADEPRSLLLRGQYAEAAEQYAALAEKDPVEAAVGQARCLRAEGKDSEAEKLLRAALARHEGSAPILALLAQIAFDRGDYTAAQKDVDAALQADTTNCPARWLAAELHRVHGRIAEAKQAYRWFYEHYNRTVKFTSADNVYYCGRGIAQYARWSRNSRLFHDLVGVLYPQARKIDANYWPALLAPAELYLEKYNQADAASDLDAALAINPNAAELHAARAELALQGYEIEKAIASCTKALEINPRLVAAHWFKADAFLADFQLLEAIGVLEAARKLNPASEETLGRLAAAYALRDGIREDQAGTPMGELLAEMEKRNPHCGHFYAAIAETFDRVRRYPTAAKYYGEADKRLPQLTTVRGAWGMVLMRLGDEAKAGPLLKESFDIDPFNVRVKNTLEVLKVLEVYAVLETEHFRIRFDRGYDELLVKYAAKYLEEDVYPRIVKDLGYAPKEKTLFEIFNRARNTGGHGWFSARMVGLPYIGTVGACAGQMVAMVSPGSMPQKFDWARVLRHEFVHVVNLQQTSFNIPHWYTEALAVWHEDLPRPPIWTAVLSRRHKAGKLFNLKTINYGFIRPSSGEDWALAYCQAELYAEYMRSRFGADALARLLSAYSNNLDTPSAVKRAFEVEVEDFEKGYQEYVTKVVRESGAAAPAGDEPELKFSELQKKVEESPKNASLAARLALAWFERQDPAQARRLAVAARELEAKQPLATYVLARLSIASGDTDAARKLLAEALDRASPHEPSLALLAALELKAEAHESAAELFQLGAKHFPGTDRWLKGLARIYLDHGPPAKLRPVLEQLAELNHDDPSMPRKLVDLCLESKDYSAAARWAQQGVHIDVSDASFHASWGEALVGLGKHAQAIEEFEVAIKLRPAEPKWKLALGQAYLAAGKKAEARKIVDKLSDEAPEVEGLLELLEKLK